MSEQNDSKERREQNDSKEMSEQNDSKESGLPHSRSWLSDVGAWIKMDCFGSENHVTANRKAGLQRTRKRRLEMLIF